MAGGSLAELLNRTVLLVPFVPPTWSSGPVAPSPLEAVATLLQPLSACTTLRTADLQLPKDWDARFKPFHKLVLDNRPQFLNFTLHAPVHGDSDSQRFYMQSSISAVLGVMHLPATTKSIARAAAAGLDDAGTSIIEAATAFAAEATNLLAKLGLPTCVVPAYRLIVLHELPLEFNDSRIGRGTLPPFVHPVHAPDVFVGAFGSPSQQAFQPSASPQPVLAPTVPEAVHAAVRAAVCGLASDMMRCLVDDAKAASAGGDSSSDSKHEQAMKASPAAFKKPAAISAGVADPDFSTDSSASMNDATSALAGGRGGAGALPVPAAPTSTSADAAPSSTIPTTFGSMTISKQFSGPKGCGIDVGLTAGLSQMSIVMGGARRRLQARLLKRRGDDALLAGSHLDAFEFYDKAYKGAKAATDELALSLISEARAAAHLLKWCVDNSNASFTATPADAPYLPEVSALMRESIFHADAACAQPEIKAAFEGIYGLAVSLRVKLGNYVLGNPALPRSMSAPMVQRGEVPCSANTVAPVLSAVVAAGWAQAAATRRQPRSSSEAASQPAVVMWPSSAALASNIAKQSSVSTAVKQTSGGISSIITQPLSSVSDKIIGSSSNNGNSGIVKDLDREKDAMPLAEILECISACSVYSALIRPATHQSRCLLQAAGLAYRAGLRRKGEVFMLRAARLLRSMQHSLPSDWLGQFGGQPEPLDSSFNSEGFTSSSKPGGTMTPDLSSTSAINERRRPARSDRCCAGCAYTAALAMQPLLALASSPSATGFTPQSSSAWPWPWVHSSCMVAPRSLPLAVRLCSPAELAACIAISASGGIGNGLDATHDSAAPAGIQGSGLMASASASDAIPRTELQRLAIIDLYQSGDLIAAAAVAMSSMQHGSTKTADDGSKSSPDASSSTLHLRNITLPSSSSILRSGTTVIFYQSSGDERLTPQTGSGGSRAGPVVESDEARACAAHIAHVLVADASSVSILASLWHKNAALLAACGSASLGITVKTAGKAGSADAPVPMSSPSVLLFSLLCGFRLSPSMTRSGVQACALVLHALKTTSAHAGVHAASGSCSASRADGTPANLEGGVAQGLALSGSCISRALPMLRSVQAFLEATEDDVRHSTSSSSDPIGTEKDKVIQARHRASDALAITADADVSHVTPHPDGSFAVDHDQQLGDTPTHAAGDGAGDGGGADDALVLEMSFDDFAVANDFGDDAGVNRSTSDGNGAVGLSSAYDTPGHFPSQHPQTTGFGILSAISGAVGGGTGALSARQHQERGISWSPRDLVGSITEYLLSSAGIPETEPITIDARIETGPDSDDDTPACVPAAGDVHGADGKAGGPPQPPVQTGLHESTGPRPPSGPVLPRVIQTVIMPTIYGSSWLDPLSLPAGLARF